jgi:hypothetical protein
MKEDVPASLLRQQVVGHYQPNRLKNMPFGPKAKSGQSWAMETASWPRLF